MQVKIEGDSFEKVFAMLGGIKNAAPRVIVRSTNKTSVNVRQFMVKEVAKHYNLSEARIRQNMKIIKANFGFFHGEVDSTGRPINLASYRQTRQIKKGVSAKILKNGQRHILYHAFIYKRKTKSGKEAKTVFSRRWKGRDWQRSQKLFKKWGVSSKFGVLPNKYRGIDVGYKKGIMALTGPRVEDKLGEPGVLSKIVIFGGERFQLNIDQELNFELSKL